MSRFGEQGSTLVLIVEAGDEKLLAELRVLTQDLPAHVSFLVLHENGYTEELSFPNPEEFVCHPIQFRLSTTPEAEAEAERIRERSDKFLIMMPHGLFASEAYTIELAKKQLAKVAGEMAKKHQSMTESIAQLNESVMKHSEPAQYRTPVNKVRGGKKGRGFADPRNRIIT